MTGRHRADPKDRPGLRIWSAVVLLIVGFLILGLATYWLLAGMSVS